MAKIQPPAPGETPVVRTRDAERTRAALLKAGLKEFAQNGFAGGRLERVIKTAGCNIRMVYHYYGGKEGLYTAVLEAAYARMLQEEGTLDIDLDRPLAGMLDLMRFSFDFFERHPQLEALLRGENPIHGKVVARLHPLAKGPRSRRQMIDDLIVSGQAKGLFRDDLDPVQIHLTIDALSRFHLANTSALSAFSGADVKARAWREHRLQHCLDFLEAALLNGRVKKRFVADAFAGRAFS